MEISAIKMKRQQAMEANNSTSKTHQNLEFNNTTTTSSEAVQSRTRAQNQQQQQRQSSTRTDKQQSNKQIQSGNPSFTNAYKGNTIKKHKSKPKKIIKPFKILLDQKAKSEKQRQKRNNKK